MSLILIYELVGIQYQVQVLYGGIGGVFVQVVEYGVQQEVFFGGIVEDVQCYVVVVVVVGWIELGCGCVLFCIQYGDVVCFGVMCLQGGLQVFQCGVWWQQVGL